MINACCYIEETAAGKYKERRTRLSTVIVLSVEN